MNVKSILNVKRIFIAFLIIIAILCSVASVSAADPQINNATFDNATFDNVTVDGELGNGTSDNKSVPYRCIELDSGSFGIHWLPLGLENVFQVLPVYCKDVIIESDGVPIHITVDVVPVVNITVDGETVEAIPVYRETIVYKIRFYPALLYPTLVYPIVYPAQFFSDGPISYITLRDAQVYNTTVAVLDHYISVDNPQLKDLIFSMKLKDQVKWWRYF